MISDPNSSSPGSVDRYVPPLPISAFFRSPAPSSPPPRQLENATVSCHSTPEVSPSNNDVRVLCSRSLLVDDSYLCVTNHWT